MVIFLEMAGAVMTDLKAAYRSLPKQLMADVKTADQILNR